MSASDDLKKALVIKYPDTVLSQWKRLRKKKISGVEVRLFENVSAKLLVRSVGDDLQQVDNMAAYIAINAAAKVTGLQDWVLTEPADEDDECVFLASPSTGHRAVVSGELDEEDDEYPPIVMHTLEPMYFVLAFFPDYRGENEICMMTCPKAYWDEHKCITDWQVGYMIVHLFPNIPDHFELDERSENQFVVSGGDLEEIKAGLIAAGMVYNEALLRAGQYRDED